MIILTYKKVFSIALFSLAITLPVSPVWSQQQAKLKKSIDVFGIPVKAESGVSNRKLLHVARVLAEYLDNNNNGKVDNPLVVKQLRKRKGGCVSIYSGDDGYDPCMWLFEDEIFPQGSRKGRRDATIEEVLHLITQTGYAYAYPKQFGERKGTKIAKAMDKARGGYRGPGQPVNKYPAGAWYTYDDRTCDYACMVTEYFYWGLTSILGGQSYSGRYNEIKREWTLNTKAKVKRKDKALYRLLTTKKYKLPKRLPDGKYKGIKLKIKTR